MSYEWVGIIVVAIAVVALGVWVWRKKPTLPDHRAEIAELRARLDAVPKPDIRRLHEGLARCEAQLGAIVSPDPRVDELASEVASLWDALAHIQSAQEPPQEVRMEDVPMGPRERLQAAGALCETATDRAFADQCARQFDDLEAFVAASRAPGWNPDAASLDRAFSPNPEVDLYEVSPSARHLFRDVVGDLEDLRASAVTDLRERLGIELIAPSPGTVFDPTLHEDSPTTRLTPLNQSRAYAIYARVSLGFKRGDDVVEKAWVKRYAGYEGASEPEPEPEPQIEPEAPTAEESAARSLLQQAAEHGNS